MKDKFVKFYDRNYKVLLAVAVIISLACLAVIITNYATTGELFKKGVSLKGGSVITVQLYSPPPVAEMQSSLRGLTSEDLSVRKFSSATGTALGVIVETSLQNVSSIVAYVEDNYQVETINVETVGPQLGESFFRQLIIAVIIAFALMAAVIFAYFRSPLPSSYVILSAVVDILFPLAMVILLDIRVSAAGIAAFLMLIGYSVDTDILLTTRVLKRTGGSVSERIYSAFSTGTIMTLTAMAATGIAYITTPSEILKQITMILFFGLVADLWSTWMQNAGLLKLYVEKKERVREEKNG